MNEMLRHPSKIYYYILVLLSKEYNNDNNVINFPHDRVPYHTYGIFIVRTINYKTYIHPST